MLSRRSSRSLSLRLASAPLLVGGLIVHALAGCSADSSTAPVEASSPSATHHTASSTAVNGRYALLSTHLTTEMQSAPRIGQVPRSTPMSLTLGLAADHAAIRAAVARVMDPSDPEYRHFLTPEQFAERFGASDADYQSVVAWALAKGFTVTPHKGRLAVDVQGTSGDVEDAFAVQMVYAHRKDGSQFYAPDREPTIDLVIPLDVIGNIQVYHPFLLPLTGGSGSGGAIQGKDLRNAYTSCTTLDGTGQSIGIFMLDDFSTADVTTYMSTVGLAAPTTSTFSSVPANSAGNPNTTKDANYGWSEGDTDVELALTMAPGAHIVAFTGSDIDTILNNMADAPSVAQLFSSWSINNLDSNGQASIARIALQGQAFFVGSGDLGAYPLTGTNPNVQDFTPSAGADFRQQQGVTVVGATTLTMTSSGATYGSETAWTYPSGTQSYASGGGFAPFAASGATDSNATPSYQASFVSANANGASSTYRNFPDVSAAGQNVNTYTSGQWVPQSGTGVATAIWAGFIALANEAAANASQPAVGVSSSLGAINPALYAMAQGSQYAANFHDITTGTNPESSVSSAAPITPAFSYSAGTGYDLVTGLGSPTCALIADISNTQCKPLSQEAACLASTTCGAASDGCGGFVQCFNSNACAYGSRCQTIRTGFYGCRSICPPGQTYCSTVSPYCFAPAPSGKHLFCPIQSEPEPFPTTIEEPRPLKIP